MCVCVCFHCFASGALLVALLTLRGSFSRLQADTQRGTHVASCVCVCCHVACQPSLPALQTLGSLLENIGDEKGGEREETSYSWWIEAIEVQTAVLYCLQPPGIE